MPFAWTQAALDDLHRLFVRENLSAAETARHLGSGVSRHAVLGKVQRLGWVRETAPKAGRPPQASRTVRASRRPQRSPASAPFARVLPLPSLREIDTASTPKPWTERAERECAFPIGEPKEPGRQYSCCAPVHGRGDYCAAHRSLMTEPGTALTQHDVESIVALARRGG